MKSKRLGVYILFGFIMLHYQNCAPPAQDFTSEDNFASDQVSVIDEIQAGQVFFPQTKVSAHNASGPVAVIGTCDQAGALIGWRLQSSSGDIIERGLAECETGSFVVELSNEWQNFCNETLTLTAALGAKATSTTEVIPECE